MQFEWPLTYRKVWMRIILKDKLSVADLFDFQKYVDEKKLWNSLTAIGILNFLEILLASALSITLDSCRWVCKLKFKKCDQARFELNQPGFFFLRLDWALEQFYCHHDALSWMLLKARKSDPWSLCDIFQKYPYRVLVRLRINKIFFSNGAK